MTSQDLSHWQPRPTPTQAPLPGRFVRLEALDAARHGDDLWQALQGPDPALWDYLPYGPFASREPFDAWLRGNADSRDPLFYTVIDQASGRALGVLSFLRITPKDGVIEIGHIAFGKDMQRTPGSTEAVWLLARHAFDDLGYRRLEWKCNARNARSMRAAERLGFSFEGLFRQHMIVKGENRDTAWFSILDGEWPQVRAGFECWLAVDNFDGEGRQKQSLEALRG
ncbi:GNAT family N-acetyltransferase [Metapseudomonas resinovorans]|uniref:Putative acetyltransferase n=1 Tax=Metapseudomonas resinovorans NBRC 106553 TaxID=1245471 RepID=S6AKB9_METRE|nr:GNAT family protein [Pseudomonas resinovorans]BAN51322.1 putative acetyltransferase [Pseudomonas resinovorans NBRC 106553]